MPKGDRSVVREVTSHRSDAAIAQAIIALARCLEPTVMVEGVPTEAQAAFMRNQQRMTGLFLLPAGPSRGDDGHSEGRGQSGGFVPRSGGGGSRTAAVYRSGTAAVARAGCDRMGVARMKVTVAMRPD